MDSTNGRDPDDGQRRRTEGDVTGLAPVQVALALLVVFLGLLALWVVWPILFG